VPEKPKTPPPPRRVQAPKVRSDRRGHGPTDRRRALLLIAAAVGALVLIGVTTGAVLLLSGGDDEQRATNGGSGVCTEKSFRALSRDHVNNLNAKPKYNSFPPTSGPHHPQWVIWGFYDDPVLQVQAVHNLEHGGIVIQYGDKVSDEDIGALREFWQDDPNGVVVAPLPRLGDKVAATAWERAGQNERGNGRGHLLTCTGFDEGELSDFRDENRFKGPEDVPPEALEPGE
jgi:hypothetical protein